MSFNVGITTTPIEDQEIGQALLDLFHSAPGEGLKSQADNQAEHKTKAEAVKAITAAGDVARQLLAALGPKWAKAGVMVSGHTNPGNDHADGWANDCITVTVNVLEYAPPVD